jgi:hypothetical protein
MASSKRKRPSKPNYTTRSKNQPQRDCNSPLAAASWPVGEKRFAALSGAPEGTDDFPEGSTTRLKKLIGEFRLGRPTAVKSDESTDSVSQSAVTQSVVTQTPVPANLSLGVVCRRLGLDYGQTRSAIARGISPTGVDPKPGSGFHRHFTYAQAYHLAVALKINDAGVYLPLAGKFAAAAPFVLEATTQGWGQDFAPFAGKLTTRKRWRLEVGNGQLLRIVTNAHSKRRGWDHPYAWFDLETRQPVPESDVDITVIVQVNLVRIAEMLTGKPACTGRTFKAQRISLRTSAELRPELNRCEQAPRKTKQPKRSEESGF